MNGNSFWGGAKNCPKQGVEEALSLPRLLHQTVVLSRVYMGGGQNYSPFLDPYYNRAPNI